MKTITDGTAKFVVRDKRMQALVDMFYPVGTVYATTSGTKPEFMQYGTWEEISKGRVLQGVDTGESAGATKKAGLPDLVGYLPLGMWGEGEGVFKSATQTIRTAFVDNESAHPIEFLASKYNSIYGNSNTVQPPAYLVHFYKRIS